MKASLILFASLIGWQAMADEPAVPAPIPQLTSEVEIKNADGSVLMTVLASTFGQSLYTFDPDSGAPGSSACDGKCAETWPPITVKASEVAALNNPEFGAVKRASGLLQLTYNGKPVYTFNMDRAAGDIKGDGIGGVWHIIPE